MSRSAASRLLHFGNRGTLQNLINRHLLRPSTSDASIGHLFNPIAEPQIFSPFNGDAPIRKLHTFTNQLYSSSAAAEAWKKSNFSAVTGQFPMGLSTIAGAEQSGSLKTQTLRPLSPHLAIYKPQLTSTTSIFNRISGSFLSAVVLIFYLLYMKIGLISLTFENFYQFMFYSSKLIPISLEISALALSYHVYVGIRHLLK